MEKYEMTSLDLRFLVKELNEKLVNGYFRKIYQYEYAPADEKTHQFLFEIFVPGKGQQWLFVDKNKMFLTNYKKPSPAEPPNFCLLLRKYLDNSKILKIKQHEFDRVIEISTERNVLVIELFSDGNVILCDNEFRIMMPLYVQQWKDRELKPKIPYAYPPARINPFAVKFEYFREYLSRFDKKIIAVLAAGFGFGPVYAKEICVRSKVDESIQADQLSVNLMIHLFNTISEMENVSAKPVVYENFVSPFPLENPEAGKTKRSPENFSGALDEFFSEQQIRMADEFEKRAKSGHDTKFKRILKEQETSLGKWSAKREEKKSKADLIYSNYLKIENILNGINSAKSSGMNWKEIKTAMKMIPEAGIVKEIREKEGKVIVELEGQEIELDFRKSIAENAGEYYEKSKLAKRKIAGVHEAMEKTRKRLEEKVETEKIDKPVRFEKKEKKWFEKFRWFNSSDGLLVVGGKDATSNEVLLKKYTDKNDLVFHSDIHGSPFVVIKSSGSEIPDMTKKEAAEFTAAYSKAWQSGLWTVDVYFIKPEQVSKQPRPGEYLPKGSFMIYGERKWFRNAELKLAIGVKIEREKAPEIISGPVSSVRRQTDSFVVVKPGEKEGAHLARTIRSTLLIKSAPENREAIEKLLPGEFQKFIPGGKGEISE